MTHPYTSQPNGEEPKGFSYEPGSPAAPVTGVPYPEGMAGFAVPPKPPRPGLVNGAVVLLWVMAGLTIAGALLLGLLTLLRAAQPPDQRSGPGPGSTMLSTAGIVSGALMILLLLSFAALMMVAAIRIPKKADSGRVLALTLMGFFVFSNLSYLVVTVGGFTSGRTIVATGIIILLLLVIAAMPALVIIFLSQKKTVAWFYDKTPITPPSAFTVPGHQQAPPPGPPPGPPSQ